MGKTLRFVQSHVGRLVIPVIGVFLAHPLFAAEAAYVVPRTEHGHPDLQGVWNFTTRTPFIRPEEFGNREFLTADEIQEQDDRRQQSLVSTAQREAEIADSILNNPANGNTGAVNNFWFENTGLTANQRTSLIVFPSDGQLPAINEGVRVQRSDAGGVREIPGDRPVRYTHGGIDRSGPEDRGLSERCLVFNAGPPLMNGPYNNNLQIFQNSDHVVILTEMGFDARIVPLDGREHVDAKITSWSGDSRGWFDGESLVVETRNFTDKIGSIGLRELAIGDASGRTLTERFTPLAEGVLEYMFTIDDPATFADRLIARWPMTRVDENIYEYACHAGNYALRNILRGARVEEDRNNPREN